MPSRAHSPRHVYSLAPNARRHVRCLLHRSLQCNVCLSIRSVVSSSHSNAGRPYRPHPNYTFDCDRMRVCTRGLCLFRAPVYYNIGMPHTRTNPHGRACTCTRVRYECMVRLDARAVRFAAIHRGLLCRILAERGEHQHLQPRLSQDQHRCRLSECGRRHREDVLRQRDVLRLGRRVLLFHGRFAIRCRRVFQHQSHGRQPPTRAAALRRCRPRPDLCALQRACACLFVCRCFGLFVLFVLVRVRALVRAHTHLCVCAA